MRTTAAALAILLAVAIPPLLAPIGDVVSHDPERVSTMPWLSGAVILHFQYETTETPAARFVDARGAEIPYKIRKRAQSFGEAEYVATFERRYVDPGTRIAMNPPLEIEWRLLHDPPLEARIPILAHRFSVWRPRLFVLGAGVALAAFCGLAGALIGAVTSSSSHRRRTGSAPSRSIPPSAG